MIITRFNSKVTKRKNPMSPYDDLTFDFESIEVQNLSSAFRIMVNSFILNLPINTNIRTYRRKSALKKYYNELFEYLIIDIDDIYSEKDRDKILSYFKNYKCIIGESRSYDGVTKFNLKGILVIEPLNISALKLCVQQIHDDISQYGNLDIAVARIPSLNAPILKYSIFYENSNGIPFKFIFKPSYSSKTLNKILNNDFEIPKIDIENIQNLEELCLKVFTQMGFESIKTNGCCIMFKHPSEKKTPGGYFWFKDSPFIMHHYNAQKSVNIFSKIKELPEAKKFLNKEINYNKLFSLYNINYNHIISISEQFITVSDYIKDAITSFLNQKNGLFTIKSPMGSGKSVIISELIQDALELDLRILVCTNRISVANDFKKKYNLKTYNEDKYKLNDSIIVQYDSIWKYNIKNFDLIILDEFISLLLHSRNSINNTAQNLAKFFACFNCKTVIADAFLTGYENIFFKKKSDNLWYIENTYREETDLYQYADYNCFIQSILIHAKKHKLTISCTSLNTIFALKKMLENYKIKVVTLTAETPQCTKTLIYKLFQNEENDKYDVLIYSPTLTVGVSNLNNIEYHFHYDSSSACDVISSLQMIKRTRKAKEIHLYIKNKINYLKTTYKEIKDDYTENYSNNEYFFTFTNYGDLRLSPLGEKAIYIDLLSNILEYSHKKAFEYLLQFQFNKKCVIIDKMFTTNILLPYIKEVKKENEEYKNSALEEYLSLSGFDRSVILDFKKQNMFEFFEEIENSIVDECPNEIRIEIIKKQVKNSSFIPKIKNYKLLNSSKDDIKSYISYCLIRNPSEVKFWNSVLKLKEPIMKEYLPGYLDNNLKLKNILKECGYILTDDISKKYKVDTEIEKFKDWIK